MMNTKVWIVTGASQGLGLATVKYLLAKKQIVIATTRDKNKFADLTDDNLEVISLDLNSDEAVRAAMHTIISTYGQIDVLINNAGYGYVGAIEEASQQDIEQIMAINLYASIRMVRYVLPYMRAAHSGHIINLSSLAGFVGSPGFGVYNAAKFAVEGYSEALALELKDLGIKVTIIEPGAFRTNFLDSSLAVSKESISDYDSTVGLTRQNFMKNNGNQAGNPELAAEAIAEITEDENPPMRLILGKVAYARAIKELETMRIEFERMKQISVSRDYIN